MANYTIRVYGLWINDHQEILLSDERIRDIQFTKFPGGGMEVNEGTLDCLKREWQEELALDIEIIEHFYTTDYYQASAFHENTQVLSIYYLVRPIEKSELHISSKANNFTYEKEKEESFRFVPLVTLHQNMLSFPIDKHVVGLLKETARQSEP